MGHGKIIIGLLAGLLWAETSPLLGTESPVKPVTPNAAPEAVELLKLAAGKPLALAEVGRPPTIEILTQQPGWTWWMTWAGMGGGRRGAEGPNVIRALVNDPRSWSLSNPDYIKAITPLRKASDLPPAPPVPPMP